MNGVENISILVALAPKGEALINVNVRIQMFTCCTRSNIANIVVQVVSSCNQRKDGGLHAFMLSDVPTVSVYENDCDSHTLSCCICRVGHVFEHVF